MDDGAVEGGGGGQEVVDADGAVGQRGKFGYRVVKGKIFPQPSK